MKCPICSFDLVGSQDGFSCPKEHGRVVSPELFIEKIGKEPAFTKALSCPVCRIPMNGLATEESEASVCPSCRGVWMGDGEFKTIAGTSIDAGFDVKWSTKKSMCPVCGRVMATKLVRGVEIDHCQPCGGVWLGSTELEMVSGTDYKLGRKVVCPGCGAGMMPGIIYGVEIDVCPRCSHVWLDQGEMEMLARKSAEGLVATARSDATAMTPGIDAVIRVDAPESAGGMTVSEASGKNLLAQVQKANESFLRDRAPTEGAKAHGRKVLIIACMDPRVTPLLYTASGIPERDAYTIRNAGATATGIEEIARSAAIAVYAANIQEILVIGHTDCAVAKLTSSSVEDAMKKRGVSPASVTKGDLLGWLGGFATERNNVLTVVERLRKFPGMPGDIPIHGLLLDIETGRLEVVASGYGK